jgi:hypothetical protein
MTTPLPTKATTTDLADEARRYLDVVEAFRAAGCEPRWRPELRGGKEHG